MPEPDVIPTREREVVSIALLHPHPRTKLGYESYSSGPTRSRPEPISALLDMQRVQAEGGLHRGSGENLLGVPHLKSSSVDGAEDHAGSLSPAAHSDFGAEQAVERSQYRPLPLPAAGVQERQGRSGPARGNRSPRRWLRLLSGNRGAISPDRSRKRRRLGAPTPDRRNEHVEVAKEK